MNIHFIIYVSDQERSTGFYRQVLGFEPVLQVKGMTEFQLSDTTKLGIMPAAGISQLLRGRIRDPNDNVAPRAEIYLHVDDPALALQKAVQAGASLIEYVAPRDWGDEAGYCLDMDNHIIAFARTSAPESR